MWIAERAEVAPEEGFGGVVVEVVSASGPTAFEAVAKLRAKLDRRQTFGYVDYILFGEDAVSDDLAKYADYPARSPEFRFSPKAFVVHGGSAKDLLSDTNSADVFVLDSLDNFKSNANSRSDVKLVRYIELMNMLDRRDAAVILPAVTGREPEDIEIVDGELPEKKLSFAGYAVVRDFKLCGYFDADITRGYNFLTGNVKSCAYSISDGHGNYAGLDVMSDGWRVVPHFDGGELVGVTIFVDVNAAVTEQRTRADIHTRQGLSRLSAHLSRAIEEEMQTVIAKSKEFGLDCFGLGDKIKLRHPYKWRKIENKWREIYQEIDIDAAVNANIGRVYDLRETSG